MTEERLRNITTTLGKVQQRLVQIIDTDTILVGHSLECDLQALKLAHPHVIDTSVIYQHPRGPPFKPKLKWLTHKWLKRTIQENPEGHDSAEDAKACIDLLKMKRQRGKEFGMYNIDMEPIFTRLKRRGVDSAVIEVGAKGGMSWDSVRTTLSARTDEELMNVILEVIMTDHGFVWGKARELEIASKWRDDESEPTKEEMDTVLAKFDANIQRLWDALPPCTALMVISGTGDPRDMSKLLAKKKRVQDEFQKKKWDDLSVQWTDVEAQAYNVAVDKARTGLAFVAIK
jgi:RNA exonuclease 1